MLECEYCFEFPCQCIKCSEDDDEDWEESCMLNQDLSVPDNEN